jgi:cyclophilin family peptidyl-prolyl cis-trans isomerase
MLTRHATSTDADTRMSVARGLAHGAAGDSLAQIARAALERLIADSDAQVRAVAVQSLASYGPAARDAVMSSLRDADQNVRVAASGVLDHVLPGRQADWLVAFDSDTSFAVRRGIVSAAARAGVMLPILDRRNPGAWQRHADWRHRAAAADAAGGASFDRALTAVRLLMRDPDGRVRVAAYAALAPWLDSADAPVHPSRRAAILESLGDDDPYVRATGLGALASRAAAADARLALDGYQRATRDSAADARVAAIQLMAAAWAHDSTRFSDSLRAAVRGVRVPEDLRERLAAGRGSVWTAWHRDTMSGAALGEGAGPSPHPQAWYDSVVQAVVLPALAGRPNTATIVTSRGPLDVTLLGDDAPLTVANFIALARRGYYRGTAFHRVVPAFVAQDGDPRGDGNGGPPYAIRDEFNRQRYIRGAVGMALSGPETGGSQYFLTLTRQPHLDGHYTAFGILRAGFPALDRIVQGDAITQVEIH